jgi:predicted PurR-regulated permease PerM
MSREKPDSTAEREKGVKPTLVIAYGAVVGALASVLVGLLRLLRETPPAGTQALPESSPPEGSLAQVAAPTPEGAPVVAAAAPALVGGEAKPEMPSGLAANDALPLSRASGAQWSRTTKYIVGVGLFLALLFIVFISRSAIPMVIFAAIMAFIVQPVIHFFTRRLHMRRGPATVVTYLLVVVVLILIPLILIPALIDATNFALHIDFQAVTESITRAVESAAAWVADVPVLGLMFGPGLDALSQTLQSMSALETPEPISLEASVATLGERLSKTAGLLVNVLGPLISAIVAFVFMLLISLHMSLSGQQLFDGLTELIPPAHRSEIVGLINRIGNVWAAFLRGQLALMFFIGTMVWLGNLALGTPQALSLGILAGLLEVIPSLGPLLAAIPAVAVALLFGSTHFAIDPLLFALIVILLYALVQSLENQVVVPKILGDAVDLPPLIVLLGVFIGGSLFGILGIFLATPVISSSKEVFIYLYNKILKTPPVEKPPEEESSWRDRLQNLVQRIKLPGVRKTT